VIKKDRIKEDQNGNEYDGTLKKVKFNGRQTISLNAFKMH
jgi:hypothetical protein